MRDLGRRCSHDVGKLLTAADRRGSFSVHSRPVPLLVMLVGHRGRPQKTVKIFGLLKNFFSVVAMSLDRGPRTTPVGGTQAVHSSPVVLVGLPVARKKPFFPTVSTMGVRLHYDATSVRARCEHELARVGTSWHGQISMSGRV